MFEQMASCTLTIHGPLAMGMDCEFELEFRRVMSIVVANAQGLGSITSTSGKKAGLNNDFECTVAAED